MNDDFILTTTISMDNASLWWIFPFFFFYFILGGSTLFRSVLCLNMPMKVAEELVLFLAIVCNAAATHTATAVVHDE